MGAPVVGATSLRQGLVCALVPQTGRRVTNLIDGTGGRFQGSAAFAGPYLNFPSAGAPFVDWGAGAAPLLANLALGPLSIVARVFLRTGCVGGLVERSDGNTVNAGWMVGISDGTAFSNRGLSLTIVKTTSDFEICTSTVVPANRWVTVAICTRDPVTGSGTSRLYFDAVPQPFTIQTDGSGSQGADLAQNFWIGKASFAHGAISAATSFNGLIDCLYIWRRFLRHEEVRALTVDPYLPFVPAPGALCVPKPAPLGPSTFPVPTIAP